MLKKTIISLFLGALILLPTQGALAETTKPAILDKLEKTGKAAQYDTEGDKGNIGTKVGGIIKAALSLIGILLVLLLLYGGFRWMTAAGNEDQVTEAKNVIKNAVIGIVIILISYSITTFVIKELNKATGGETGSIESGATGAL